LQSISPILFGLTPAFAVLALTAASDAAVEAPAEPVRLIWQITAIPITGTSSSRHRRELARDFRPDGAELPRADQGMRMCNPYRSRVPPSPPSGLGANGHATVTVPGTRRFPTESNNRTNPQLPAMDDRLAPELLLTRSGIWEARFRSIETAGKAAVKQNRHFWTMRHEKLTSSGPGSRSNTSPRPNRDGSLAAGEGLREMPTRDTPRWTDGVFPGRAGRLWPRGARATGAARGAWGRRPPGRSGPRGPPGRSGSPTQAVESDA
jgi:hypothetical protein